MSPTLMPPHLRPPPRRSRWSRWAETPPAPAAASRLRWEPASPPRPSRFDAGGAPSRRPAPVTIGGDPASGHSVCTRDPEHRARLARARDARAGRPLLPPVAPLDEPPLPERYEVDEIVAIAVDPRTLYLYWEVRPTTLAHARAEHPDGWLCVRVATVIASWEGPVVDTRDLHVDALYGDRFLRDIQPGSNVRVSVGWRSAHGFEPFAVGSEVTAPRAVPVEPVAQEVARWEAEPVDARFQSRRVESVSSCASPACPLPRTRRASGKLPRPRCAAASAAAFVERARPPATTAGRWTRAWRSGDRPRSRRQHAGADTGQRTLRRGVRRGAHRARPPRLVRARAAPASSVAAGRRDGCVRRGASARPRRAGATVRPGPSAAAPGWSAGAPPLAPVAPRVAPGEAVLGGASELSPGGASELSF